MLEINNSSEEVISHFMRQNVELSSRIAVQQIIVPMRCHNKTIQINQIILKDFK